MRATPGTRKRIEPLGVDPERPDRHRDHAACVRLAARAAVRNREPALPWRVIHAGDRRRGKVTRIS
jgi:LmbE family N-acetylglucosaminyl deacetylase